MSEKYSVAIDGPSGAGKSTLAKAAAAALGICYVDTGAIYRTIGYGVYPGGSTRRTPEPWRRYCRICSWKCAMTRRACSG